MTVNKLHQGNIPCYANNKLKENFVLTKSGTKGEVSLKMQGYQFDEQFKLENE